MARGLDHVAHAVRDLDSAADFYRRMGFTVGTRNRHSWGTHNSIVQLPGFFVELLTIGEPEKLGDDGLSTMFGKFNRDFIARQEGLSFLVLESTNAKADAADFAKAGIGASEALPFEREAKRPDGATVKVGFSLAFARDALAPQTSFAVCQQHYPENFWNPQFQTHANSVNGIAGVVMVADSPTDQQIFLSAFTSVRDLQSTSSGITVKTPRGEIQVMEPRAFTDHFGTDSPDVSHGARLASLRFKARALEDTARILSAGNVTHRNHMGRVIVAPSLAMGATIAFES